MSIRNPLGLDIRNRLYVYLDPRSSPECVELVNDCRPLLEAHQVEIRDVSKEGLPSWMRCVPVYFTRDADIVTGYRSIPRYLKAVQPPQSQAQAQAQQQQQQGRRQRHRPGEELKPRRRRRRREVEEEEDEDDEDEEEEEEAEAEEDDSDDEGDEEDEDDDDVHEDPRTRAERRRQRKIEEDAKRVLPAPISCRKKKSGGDDLEKRAARLARRRGYG